MDLSSLTLTSQRDRLWSGIAAAAGLPSSWGLMDAGRCRVLPRVPAPIGTIGPGQGPLPITWLITSPPSLGCAATRGSHPAREADRHTKRSQGLWAQTCARARLPLASDAGRSPEAALCLAKTSGGIVEGSSCSAP